MGYKMVVHIVQECMVCLKRKDTHQNIKWLSLSGRIMMISFWCFYNEYILSLSVSFIIESLKYYLQRTLRMWGNAFDSIKKHAT